MNMTTSALALCAALALAPAVLAQETVTIGMQQEPTVLDPTVDATASIDGITAHNIYESLTTVSESGEILPALAESWEVSEDGLTYTFNLVEGALFHDGSTFDADDVKFTFDRAMAEDSVNPSKGIFEPIASVETPDAGTVVITLSQPDAFFLFNIAQGDASIVAPETAETNTTNPVGTGPYRFDSWTRGDRLTLVANPEHRDYSDAVIDTVTIRFVADPAAAVAALMAEDIDAFPGMPAPEVLEQFKADPRYDVVVGTTEGEVILALNNSRPPFDDIRVRRAVNHALDREAIIHGAYFGYGEPIGSFFPPHHRSHVDLTDMYPHDPAAARALLEEAGAVGTEVTLRLPHFPYAKRSGEIIQAQLEATGFEVSIENVEWAFWIGEIYSKLNYDMTVIAHTSPNDLGNFARGPEYFYGYDNAEFNALWEAIRTEPDPERLDALLKDGQRFVAEQAVHGFLFQLPKLGVYRTGLSGYWQSSPVLFSPLNELRWES
ncbi:ABC transporter substrate-binding protein [Thalassococcus sp. S3]|uniref:ABC transporter substrate-binding protein n=1 Tax=Thalassococcus sp. S3 TaxID=2017482 RepID=UPI0010241328|nr:ABC transporter substrate-binding protein [Thalassococcus sp. S3]QBF32016.1 ABC transporter substrate-binding protein [Thalassococcus sp. S3]